jgi:hypothetical protein
MRDFIDISLSPTDTDYPYLLFVFRNGALVDVTRHHQVDTIVETCRYLELPVVAIDPQLRAELRAYGIHAQPPKMRTVGN